MIYCIPLSKQKIALVDEEDYRRLGHHRWYALETKSGKFYAARTEKRKAKLLHREILGVSGKNRVDHVRREHTLDCRRANLRECSQAQNGQNRGKNKNNTSGFKGVFWHKQNQMWRVRIHVDGKIVSRGLFPGTDAGKEQAARAYDKAAMELHGEFACLNFPI